MAEYGTHDLWRSATTKYLATAAYLDDEFRRAVLNGVYFEPSRMAAPSYGFDAVPVLFHCRQAWRWQVCRDVLVLAALVVGFKLSAVIGATVIVLSLATYLLVSEGRLVRRSIQELSSGRISGGQFVARLARSWIRSGWLLFGYLVLGIPLLGLVTGGGVGSGAMAGVRWLFTGSAPAGLGAALLVFALVVVASVGYRLVAQRVIDGIAAENTAWRQEIDDRLREIGREQYGPIVRYSGFEPFVGSGRIVRDWSIAHRLTPAAEGAPVSPAGAGAEGDATDRPSSRGRWSSADIESFPTPFDAVELVDHLRARFETLKDSRRDSTQRLRAATVSERTFLNGRYSSPFAGRTPTREERDEVLRNPDGAARHHLVCQASPWDGELVVTVYVLVSVEAGMLHVELVGSALGPTKSEYHLIHQPGGVGPAAQGRALSDGLRATPGVLLLAPVRLLGALRDRLFRQSRGVRGRRDGVDCGAALSIRELATGNVENYYQLSDATRFLKLVERRLLADITEFLADAGVDVSDFGERVGAILNNTLINNGAFNTGSGGISVDGSVLGQHNTARKDAVA